MSEDKKGTPTASALLGHYFDTAQQGLKGLFTGAKERVSETAAVFTMQQKLNDAVFEVGKEVADQIIMGKNPPYEVTSERTILLRTIASEIHKLKTKTN